MAATWCLPSLQRRSSHWLLLRWNRDGNSWRNTCRLVSNSHWTDFLFIACMAFCFVPGRILISARTRFVFSSVLKLDGSHLWIAIRMSLLIYFPFSVHVGRPGVGRDFCFWNTVTLVHKHCFFEMFVHKNDLAVCPQGGQPYTGLFMP